LFMFRNTGLSCFNVIPLHENHCSTLFTIGYKKLPKGGRDFCFENFALRLCLWFEPFCYWLSDGEAFLMWEVFGREKNFWREKNCWRRIAKGKLLASLRAETLRKL
jgi:hypothetical protein